MSDFTSPVWSGYITVVTLAGIVACIALLWGVGRKARIVKGETTGHVWDGDLQELNNPLPMWWVWLFYITIAFGFAYLALYPGLGSYSGTLGWTQAGQHQAEQQALDERTKPIYDAYLARPVNEVARDPQARAIGERLFLNNCAQCHGSDARGAKGYPNLADGDWLYGGTAEAIKASIRDGRAGVMPPMAAAIGGGDADVQNVAQYVLSLSGSASDPVKAEIGKSKFAVCAACHGARGEGNPALGAPNLTDQIWLHGGGAAAVERMIREGKANMMPAHKDRFTEGQIHVLGAFVWSLSNPSQ